MKHCVQLLLLTLVIGVFSPNAQAEAPRQPRLMQYSRLWAPSPFTKKPMPKPVEQVSPIERDWTLGSVRPGPQGYSVTLINKKNRKERIQFIPGISSGEFSLIQVKVDPQSYKNAKVQVKKGSQTAWIGYDEAFVKPRVTATKKSPTPAKGRTSSNRPPIPGRTSSSSKKPSRPRFIPRK